VVPQVIPDPILPLCQQRGQHPCPFCAFDKKCIIVQSRELAAEKPRRTPVTIRILFERTSLSRENITRCYIASHRDIAISFRGEISIKSHPCRHIFAIAVSDAIGDRGIRYFTDSPLEIRIQIRFNTNYAIMP